MEDGQVYAFGPFRVDAREQVVFRDGVPIPLTPKAIAILLVLLEHRGHLVEKSQIMDTVWPNLVVEEGNLTQNIYSLRKRLGARAECGIAIETVSRRGYRLVGDVALIDPASSAAPERDAGRPDTAAGGTGVDSSAATGSAELDGRGAGAHRDWGRAAVVGSALAAVVISTASLFSPDVVVTRGRVGDLVTRPVNMLAGDKLHPSLSPDGERAAFVWNRGDGHNVFISQIATGSTVQLTYGPGGTAYPAWSPDGRSVAFIRRFVATDGERRAALFVVPSSGGSPRMVWSESVNNIGWGLDWSPDGTCLLFAARRSPESPYRVALADVATGAVQWPRASSEEPESDEHPTFSPDGQQIAFVRRETSGSHIDVIRVDGGLVRTVPVSDHDIRRIAWTADGHRLIFGSRVGAQLWSMSVTGGDADPVPGIGEGALDPSVARRAGRLIFRHVRLGINLYRVGLDGPSAPTLIAGTTRSERQPSIAPDGTRIAFVSGRTGTDEIWLMQTDGSAPTQLTHLGSGVRSPRWSPDGRSIAFSAYAPGGSDRQIYVTHVADGLTRRVTSETSVNVFPAWSHDGQWLYFLSNLGGRWEIWRVPSAGGVPQQVTTDQGRKPWLSADGRFLYYSNDAPAIWRRPLGGGERTLVLRQPPLTSWGGDWVLTDRGIYWVSESASQSIEFHDFATGRSSVVLKLPAPYDSGMEFSIAPDGSWMVYGQRDYEANDVMMMESPFTR